MVSVSASLMTAEFNKLRWIREFRWKDTQSVTDLVESMNSVASFDSRVFTIPDRVEVMNYFIWRNNDAARNSISMVAQSLYSHKELHGMSSSDKQEMLFQKGINWSDYDKSLKNGRLIVREVYRHQSEPGFVTSLPKSSADSLCGEINLSDGKLSEPMMRTKWVVKPADKFTQIKDDLLSMIPNYE
jgi:tRNA(His) 5'-end guanylyltransferase